MRIIGSVIGAPRKVATRRSVIFSCEGFEFLLTFCTAPSRVSSDQKDVAAAAPANLKRERRPSFLVGISRTSVKPQFISFRRYFSDAIRKPTTLVFHIHGVALPEIG